jgi:hypothetical protein
MCSRPGFTSHIPPWHHAGPCACLLWSHSNPTWSQRQLIFAFHLFPTYIFATFVCFSLSSPFPAGFKKAFFKLELESSSLFHSFSCRSTPFIFNSHSFTCLRSLEISCYGPLRRYYYSCSRILRPPERARWSCLCQKASRFSRLCRPLQGQVGLGIDHDGH